MKSVPEGAWEGATTTALGSCGTDELSSGVSEGRFSDVGCGPAAEGKDPAGAGDNGVFMSRHNRRDSGRNPKKV